MGEGASVAAHNFDGFVRVKIRWSVLFYDKDEEGLDVKAERVSCPDCQVEDACDLWSARYRLSRAVIVLDPIVLQIILASYSKRVIVIIPEELLRNLINERQEPKTYLNWESQIRCNRNSINHYYEEH